MTIQEAQNNIIEEFGLLDGDMEMSNVYLMELGQKLPDYPEDKRDEEHIVKGCQSKVWLNAKLEDGKVVYEADSNTAITKGLVSLLIRVFSGQTPDDILHADIYFAEKIGMNRFIGTQRSNGFGAMIKQMKLDAMVLQKVSN
ncbi:SufE family protein [Marinigracilibium pacificum]|uniref:SufE family protein n=1 Tax=Marinigracilibium pacificum TaxID=2729599 RepID=A0A848J445_9BACT|nr:SufE family protein [Marinigracilibium pacificum]NMM50501.1 SufE family protein [Marinigracilibium pacificum]